MASRKTGREARIERITWYAIVLVVILMNFFDRNLILPPYLVPIVISAILIGSSVYQQVQGYGVSLISWGVAIGLVLFAVFEIYYNLPFDLRLLSIIGVVVVILSGIITNEG